MGILFDQGNHSMEYILPQIKLNAEKPKQVLLEIKPLIGEEVMWDKNASIQWKRSFGLKGVTETLIVTAQDQALSIRYDERA